MTAEMPAVSRFEFHLLRLLRFTLGQLAPEQALPLLHAKLPAPACLSPTCVRLVEQTLARGVVQLLVRAGGWRHERFLRNGEPTAGRAWERSPLEERSLRFGPASLSFLIWLTAEKVSDARGAVEAGPAPTPADELFLAEAYSALRGFPEVRPVLAGMLAFRQNALGRLSAAGDFGETPNDAVPWGEWMSGPRALFLEAMQPLLARRWLLSERAKGQFADWKAMRQRGTAEEVALSGFLAAADAAGRPDLARFVLSAAAELLAPNDLGPEYWTGGLREGRPQKLSERLETERRALGFVRQFGALAGWERRARSVGYFDEGYAASQLWKLDWERAGGDELARKAAKLLDRLEPLRTAGPPAGVQP